MQPTTESRETSPTSAPSKPARRRSSVQRPDHPWRRRWDTRPADPKPSTTPAPPAVEDLAWAGVPFA